jgi:hypothetical protein
MASLRTLFSCVGLFADKEVKAPSVEPKDNPHKYSHLIVNTEVENQSPAVRAPTSLASTTATPQSVLTSPEANTVSPQSAVDDEVTAQRRALKTNIRRIKSSPYYNAAGDILDIIFLFEKAEDSEAKLTPTERNKLHRLNTDPTSATGFISPRFSGKPFEFMQIATPSRLASKSSMGSRFYTQAEKSPDRFTVVFKNPAQANRTVSANFVVTNHENVVVVESKTDFENAKLFQTTYSSEAKSFGFLRILWVDSVKRVQLDQSDHRDWAEPAESASRLAM